MRAPFTILALDIATTTGWAVGDMADAAPACGSVRLARPLDGRGRYLSNLEAWFSNMLTKHQPALVVVEAAITAGSGSRVTAARLVAAAGLVEMICDRREVMWQEVWAGTVRKHLLGSGRASKAEVLPAIQALGWPAENHDAADACAVWLWARDVLARRIRGDAHAVL